jgi:sigma-B regulation protein RsbU (phosphoserine phosphatase)
VLGAFPRASFAEEQIQLRPGDRLLLFTDGLTEALDQNDEQFGDERLLELLCAHRDQSAEDLKEILFNAAGAFCENVFRDDAALMVIGID